MAGNRSFVSQIWRWNSFFQHQRKTLNGWNSVMIWKDIENELGITFWEANWSFVLKSGLNWRAMKESQKVLSKP
jgi:hypothetical protein